MRAFSQDLCRPLQTEDYVIQSMPDTSPAKWHLAHTSWFFETFILKTGLPGYGPSESLNSYLFNSYYNAVGPMHCRARRGMISRPTVEETHQYRQQIDAAMMDFLERGPEDRWRELAFIVALGLNHEQQHQELFLTDIKHMLSLNPLYPVYSVPQNVEGSERRSERPATIQVPGNGHAPMPLRWVSFPEGIYSIGREGEDFAFDNEGPRVLVEPGSGSSSKTRLLLDHLERPVAYVPIDISQAHLFSAAQTLNGDYFPLEILPVCADYTQPLTLPTPARKPGRTVVFFLGSTIGNFEPWQAAIFLRRIASWCKPGDGLFIGVDLQKSRELLHLAYNDAKGITAAFNLNLLQRANAELGADFVLERFRHEAIYDEAHSRIEMRLVSRCQHQVVVAGEQLEFGEGERITTEYSYKYRIETFHELAAAAGWQPERTWTDKERWFSVNYFTSKQKGDST